MKQDREEALTLEILSAIEAKSDVTQRHIADRLGVALGLANSYLKRCARKGFIKVTQAPANRYLYYLTPKGFAEKTRLTTNYLTYSFDFYRRASASVADCLRLCEEKQCERVIFAGVSELAEIGAVRCMDFSIEVIGTYDESATHAQCFGKPVWQTLKRADQFDAAIVTALQPATKMYRELTALLGEDYVVVPDIVASVVTSEQSDSE